MTDARIYATYWIETAFPLLQAAETMAGEQSTGTFVRVPGETAELREAHAARVEEIVQLGDAAAPSLPGFQSRVGPETPLDPHSRGEPGLTCAAGRLMNVESRAGLKRNSSR